jgi:hypothetical protein
VAVAGELMIGSPRAGRSRPDASQTASVVRRRCLCGPALRWPAHADMHLHCPSDPGRTARTVAFVCDCRVPLTTHVRSPPSPGHCALSRRLCPQTSRHCVAACPCPYLAQGERLRPRKPSSICAAVRRLQSARGSFQPISSLSAIRDCHPARRTYSGRLAGLHHHAGRPPQPSS